MIRVSGTAKIRVNYEVELDMTEEEFDALSEDEMRDVLDQKIDWLEVSSSAEIDDIDVWDIWDIEEVEEKATT